MLTKRTLSFALAIALAWTLSAEEVRNAERLARLGRIWGALRYSQPLLTYREVKWDDAAVRAIARLQQSDSDAELVASTSEMLAAIGDPATRVRSTGCLNLPEPARRQWRDLGDGAVYVLAHATKDAALQQAVTSAKLVVVDLRSHGGCTTGVLSDDVGALLHAEAVQMPLRVQQQHYGYRSQHPSFVAGSPYGSTWLELPRPSFAGTASTKVERAVFLIDDRSIVNDHALALVSGGQAEVVAAGRAPIRHNITTLPLIDGYEVETRQEMILDAQRRPTNVYPAATLPADASEEALIAAARAVAQKSKRRSLAGGRNPLPLFALRSDATYATMSEPALPWRVLAAFRIFNVIDHFYGYKELITWDDATFAEIIRLVGEAEGKTAYGLALAKAMTYVPDGHSSVDAPAFYDLLGRGAAPFRLMPVEGKPVVVELLHANTGVKLGDELLSVDGRPVAERAAELGPHISSAHEAHHDYVVSVYLPSGPSGTTAKYTFRRPNGTTYDVSLTRGPYSFPVPAKPWRIIDGNIGYVDLRFLEVAQIEPMLKEMQGTKGLILDIRSYPRGVFPILGRRLAVTGSTITSEMRVPMLTGLARTKDLFLQDLGAPAEPYRGRTLALIDERGISQSEHTCLTLESLAGTKFVGSPTAGANGNITHLVVPGGIYVTFTGMDVRHADGRQLQRIGIVPDYPVARTVSALAAGRDEVLEKAIAVMRE